MLNSICIERRRVLLLVEYYQLADTTLLSHLNELMTTGDVIGLFEYKELGALLAPIKGLYRKQLGLDQRKNMCAPNADICDER